jgi:hypothetical protein
MQKRIHQPTNKCQTDWSTGLAQIVHQKILKVETGHVCSDKVIGEDNPG